MEDQAVEVVGEVGKGQFRFGAGQTDCSDEQTEAVFLLANTCSTRARIEDFLKLAARVRFGIGLPCGLRR